MCFCSSMSRVRGCLERAFSGTARLVPSREPSEILRPTARQEPRPPVSGWPHSLSLLGVDMAAHERVALCERLTKRELAQTRNLPFVIPSSVRRSAPEHLEENHEVFSHRPDAGSRVGDGDGGTRSIDIDTSSRLSQRFPDLLGNDAANRFALRSDQLSTRGL